MKIDSVFFWAMFACAGLANAGSSNGALTSVMVHRSDVVMFSAGVHSEKPVCSTVANEWSFALGTESGKAMYALLLSAQAQGKSVSVVGMQACLDWADRETPQYIYMVN